jgi:electron transport complex protein RnfC
VCRLDTIIHRAGEKQLIQVLTGREVPGGGSSTDIGVGLNNISTAAAVADALTTGMPLVERICSVAETWKKPQNVVFPIGALASDVIDFCGGFQGIPSKVLLGGPMMAVLSGAWMYPL